MVGFFLYFHRGPWPDEHFTTLFKFLQSLLGPCKLTTPGRSQNGSASLEAISS